MHWQMSDTMANMNKCVDEDKQLRSKQNSTLDCKRYFEMGFGAKLRYSSKKNWQRIPDFEA